MGMTDNQFKAILREYSDDISEFLDLIRKGNDEEAEKKAEKLLARIDAALKD